VTQIKDARERVGLGDAIVMGLSSSGPAQTLAVSLAGLGGRERLWRPGADSDLPDSMLGIRDRLPTPEPVDQRPGATYTWVARVFQSVPGFLSGWMILLYYHAGTTTLTHTGPRRS